MYQTVDLFASEYGWTIEYILESVYPVQFFALSKRMLERKVNGWLMDIQVAMNPHVEHPRELVEKLQALLPEWDRIDDSPIDREGLSRLKALINRGRNG